MMDFSKLKEISVGGTPLRQLFVNGVSVWERQGGPLPFQYRQVEYIESNGKQYIDTGVLAADHPDGIRYVFDGVITGTDVSATEYLWGALNNGQRSGNLAVDEGTMRLSLSIGGVSGTIAYCGLEVGTRFYLTASGTSENPSGVTIFKNGAEGMYFTNAYVASAMPQANIFFLRVNGSSATTYASARIYGFEMYRADGTPLRHFIPCYRRSDGAVGLYDTVDGVFYTNQGTSSFAKGAWI